VPPAQTRMVPVRVRVDAATPAAAIRSSSPCAPSASRTSKCANVQRYRAMSYPLILLLCVATVVASCAWSESSKIHLLDSGYSINAIDPIQVSIEMHVNQLKQLGGEINAPQFRLFVAERLKWNGMCPLGWAPLPCVEDGSCVHRFRSSVTVPGRCIES
jgi:hypothetical protein